MLDNQTYLYLMQHFLNRHNRTYKGMEIEVDLTSK